ncbi:MAG: hypothetical protein U5J63_16220 [Fodinibius sp.]|nr:hypothetical protein [Fodinibius sp.]
MDKIKASAPDDMTILSQGNIVADSLADYLQRHPEIANQCSQNEARRFLTTDSTEDFDTHANFFWGEAIQSEFVQL